MYWGYIPSLTVTHMCVEGNTRISVGSKEYQSKQFREQVQECYNPLKLKGSKEVKRHLKTMFCMIFETVSWRSLQNTVIQDEYKRKH